MEHAGGVGLAAPQIGVDLQLVIFGFEHSERYPDAEGREQAKALIGSDRLITVYVQASPAVAQAYLEARAKLGFPMAPPDLRDEVLAKLEAVQ